MCRLGILLIIEHSRVPKKQMKKGCYEQPFLLLTFFQADGLGVNAIPQLSRCFLIVKEMAQMLSAAVTEKLNPFSSVSIQEVLLYMIPDMHPETGKACTGIKFLC